MISNDIGQIASLYASMHNMNKVYFGGYFLRNHPLSMHTISYAIKYWTNVIIIKIMFLSVGTKQCKNLIALIVIGTSETTFSTT